MSSRYNDAETNGEKKQCHAHVYTVYCIQYTYRLKEEFVWMERVKRVRC